MVGMAGRGTSAGPARLLLRQESAMLHGHTPACMHMPGSATCQRSPCLRSASNQCLSCRATWCNPSSQGACTAHVRRWQKRWRWSACGAPTASSASATSMPSGGREMPQRLVVASPAAALTACHGTLPLPAHSHAHLGEDLWFKVLLPRVIGACSGPGDVAELELGTDPASFSNLLKFLTSGFGGGTGGWRVMMPGGDAAFDARR